MGKRLKLIDANVVWAYRCTVCGEITKLSQPLMDLIILKKISQPRKCMTCDCNKFDLKNKESFVEGDEEEE